MKILLKHRVWKDYREATVLTEISHTMFVQVRDSWRWYKDSHRPVNDDRYLQFASWDWYEKAQSTTRDRHLFRALELDGKVQGMMMLSLETVPTRRKGLESKQVLYVEYLETAPWNNTIYAGDEALYQRVGTGLITLAVAESVQAGCEGRLGLHSLNTDQAQAAYRKLGFLNLGFDEAEQYTYFELPGALEEQEDR